MALSPLLQAICDVVRREFTDTPATIRLEETDPASTCPPVVIKKRGPALVLKLDVPFKPACARADCTTRIPSNDRLFPLFRNDEEGLTRVCDYIVFYQLEEERNPRVYVLLCELKSGSGAGALKQIENGKRLAEYIVATAVHHRLLQSSPPLAFRGLVFARQIREPRGGERRTVCPYQQHPRIDDLGFALCPPTPERDISFFCADVAAR
jgi:hypothetical protein